MSIQIRFAGPTDAALIYGFILDLAVYEREPDAVKTSPEQLATQLAAKAPPFEALIAELDGEAAGFALFFANYSTWRGCAGIHLEDLFVPPELRGRGVGLALLRRLAQLTVERGGARLEWAVLDWNTPAIEFYERLGALPMNEWTTFRLTDDALRRLGASA
ncbi:MAG: GNAT superfamily N-acetyltransferase [Myxococcota bacterium]|jgi:GNAT superfamily N-acetyltransferase